MTDMAATSGNKDYAAANRAHWEAQSDEYQRRHGAALAAHPLAWGVWRIPEARLRILGDVAGKDILEFGCGAAQWSIALAKLGARPVGLDQSARQLEHARRLMREGGVDFPLIETSATAVPLPDAGFDIVFCDHGATSFADPYEAIPEATRLLRPGGLLAFCLSSPLLEICYNDASERVTTTLEKPYFDLHRIEDGGQIAFQLPYGAWIRLFRENGLLVERLEELRPDEGAETTYTGYVDIEWARRWPAEILWSVRKEGFAPLPPNTGGF